ncbi:SIS domain-containing protein [uncultured Gimesia sp.]|uniref:D-sedoheptulose-7-phosphate isomerase n=1 Tax=uncultured Gimesia sp. TaxID=1678688 RepID=UPI0030DA223C|tara:strand:+ start:153182 stop:153826 length:645 start_codon:yes stop_codon:yes gene_type:complete
MHQARKIICRNLKRSIAAKKQLLEDTEIQQEFSNAVDLILQSYQSGGRLYLAGNGGSAADAQHLAAEFVCRLSKDRASIPAEALTTDSSILTAIGNDYGFDVVFSRQLEGKLTENDVFLGITTSGNSPNIVKAVQACKEKNVPSIIFTGHGGGEVRSLCDVCVIAPGELTSQIQEVHLVLEHTLCECVEAALFNFKLDLDSSDPDQTSYLKRVA